MAQRAHPNITLEDYLMLNEKSRRRYEYLDGELRLLPGGGGVVLEGDAVEEQEYANITKEDYLMLNESSKNARYEYLDGRLRMLAGGSADHSLIAANLITILNNLLEERPCLVYNSDMQLQLSESRYLYPDVTVSCDPRDEAPEDNKTRYPTVVIEVLSPSTQDDDRGWKFLFYQSHPTIQDYVLVDSQRILVEVFHREKNVWTSSKYRLNDNVELEGLDVEFSVYDVYKKTGLMRKAR
jgi:Uma2 family endonuclease